MSETKIVEEIEAWKDIPGYEGYYQVSSHGNVRSCARYVTNGPNKMKLQKASLKKQTLLKIGYLAVGLWQNNISKLCYVHELVTGTFLGKRPHLYHINHKNGNKKDNRLINLEYVTAKENVAHAISTGLSNPRGINNGHAILSENDVLEIRRLLDLGELNQRQIGKMFGVKNVIICQIKSRTRWKHL